MGSLFSTRSRRAKNSCSINVAHGVVWSILSGVSCCVIGFFFCRALIALLRAMVNSQVEKRLRAGSKVDRLL